MDLIDITVDRLIKSGFNPVNSPFAHKVAVLLTTAQGLIDNGGFEYLFGYPFEQEPIKDDFVLVYEAIGAKDSSIAFQKALSRSTSPVADYEDLNKVLWKNSEQNYALLESYIKTNAKQFA